MAEALSINPRVIDLICSRICHDLISPVSAINNGIELINETEEGVGGDAFSLIADSAAIVAGRLAVMRYAYGAATPGLDEVRSICLDYFGDSKIHLSWPKTGLGTEFASRVGFPKILLNVVLTLAEAIGAAGQVGLEGRGGEVTITAESKAGTVRTDVLAGMDAANADTLDARTIQAFITAMMATRFGFTLTKTVEDGKIVFVLK